MNKAHFYLLIVLIMLPQIVETIYSPALPSLSLAFQTAPPTMALTLSLYFIGFAIGVLIWGILSDYFGRKPILLCGLALYSLSCFAILYCTSFYSLLFWRCCAGIGIAVGSVITQTMLRDRFTATQLLSIFALIGFFIAMSPSIGLFIGSYLSAHTGYRGIFYALAGSAALLCLLSLYYCQETAPPQRAQHAFMQVAQRMLRDAKVGCFALLITAYNVLIFGYYIKAPFIFAAQNSETSYQLYSGVFFAIGSLVGVWGNRYLLRRHANSAHVATRWILCIAMLCCVLGCLCAYLLQDQATFFMAMIIFMLAYAMAIPILLAQALQHYTEHKGTASALFSFGYYIAIALGLEASKYISTLSMMFSVLSAIIIILSLWILQRRWL
ncbi:MFS transporter [Acinetobacter larvae]|uniref:Major facilitator superfamily (MFS) profile domain-containing protein n=1 Tax=Acinetobacter larvae TaxID=1789224 RepID=A0A1B2LVG8_9GAMM|nr:MFS transporter [Acinetobacter larvae]AOA56932.1 hypothetical protein BFG52_00195 [Acinetobacter larvae]